MQCRNTHLFLGLFVPLHFASCSPCFPHTRALIWSISAIISFTSIRDLQNSASLLVIFLEAPSLSYFFFFPRGLFLWLKCKSSPLTLKKKLICVWSGHVMWCCSMWISCLDDCKAFAPVDFVFPCRSHYLYAFIITVFSSEYLHCYLMKYAELIGKMLKCTFPWNI